MSVFIPRCKVCRGRLQTRGTTGVLLGKQGLLYGWTCNDCLSRVAAEKRNAKQTDSPQTAGVSTDTAEKPAARINPRVASPRAATNAPISFSPDDGEWFQGMSKAERDALEAARARDAEQATKDGSETVFVCGLWYQDKQNSSDGSDDRVSDRLRQLVQLHKEGVLADEEYEVKRAKLIDEL